MARFRTLRTRRSSAAQTKKRLIMTTTKSMIALGVLGAMLVGTAGAGYARERHTQARGTVVQKHRYQAMDRGGYARYPRADYYGWNDPYYPNVYQRPFLRWDPYGMRWDGMD
jgi:hypothetical protein